MISAIKPWIFAGNSRAIYCCN